jgi:hypothetical protein
VGTVPLSAALFLVLSTSPVIAETAMLVAKIEGSNVRVYDSSNGVLKRTFNLFPYKGAKVTEISGDSIAITCGDGKVRVFDIKNGVLRKTL